MLPKCPERSRKATETGMIVDYDYSNPSYALDYFSLLKLLGTPELSETNSVSQRYAYLAGERNGLGLWCLWIEFRDGRAVRSGLRALSAAELREASKSKIPTNGPIQRVSPE